MAEAGATANAAQSSLNDQLHDAAAIGDVAALGEALAAGADVEARRPDRTPLAADRTPLARVVDPNDYPISEERRTACVRALLLAGASPSAPITSSTGSSWTVLHEAAYLGLYTVCRLLLDAGADVNYGKRDFFTPLYYAAKRGPMSEPNQKVAALLLSRGAVDGPDVANIPYLQKVRAAGGFAAYAKQHRAKLVAMLAPKFAHVLPPELVSVVITFWAPVGLH